ncbi:MAG TPA: aminotransferase class I/II-fold pyridoxal phosphate-dependent enzyme [Firmicutes bacterium]|nr:aminotransferase class I/II-fold pyridoxal phosphate-dependent enzyme [Bacillota bacterium]
MKPLSDNVVKIPRSGIRGIMDVAEQMNDVIHLEVGQPHYDTPAHIKEAANKALQDGYTRYTPNAGLPSLRALLADKLRRVNGIKVSPEGIAVTPGGVFACASALFTIAKAGDQVLLPEPGWPNYSFQTRVIGVEPVYYHLNPSAGFLPDLDEMRSLINERTRAILINSPSNPCGSVFPEPVLRGILDLAREYDLYLISDEVYEDIVYEGKHYSPGAWDDEGRVLTVFSFSKAYAMTGWRIGYVATTEEICKNFSKFSESMVSCVSSVSQKAAEAAITGPQDFVAAMVAQYKRNRDIIMSIFAGAGIVAYKPAGAFYMLLDIGDTGLDSYAFTLKLLEAKHVAVAPGLTFGPRSDNYVRISFCKDEESVVEGARRIADFISRLYVRG